jgi:uncharacterized protein GlcG (DUF336 family)
MTRSRLAKGLLTLACGAAMLLVGVARGQAEEALVSFKILTTETAQKAAGAALAHCRKEGYQVSVAVVDRFGVLQVLLRDRFAGPHTPSTARRKAWTAVSFRTDTMAMNELAQGGDFAGIRHIDEALMVGGGVPIEAAGSIVAGIGISGAPGGSADDACARAGITAIEADINF